MIVSYSYYVMDHWIDVEYDDGWEEEKEELEEIYTTYYPPYYSDEEVTVWNNVGDFPEPLPQRYEWVEAIAPVEE